MSGRTWRSVARTLARGALLAALATVATPFACTGDSPSTSSRPGERTLRAMSPYITRELTPATMERHFGAPADTTGSGLLIYGYRLDDGQTLRLAFPGQAPITYAHLEAANGTRTTLPLR